MALTICATALLGSCRQGPPAVLDDRAAIVRAVLSTLASDGKPLCIDNRTSGSALAIWRYAEAVPAVSDTSRGWSRPQPFRPPVQADATLTPDRTVRGRLKRQMTAYAPLDRTEAATLTAIGHQLSLGAGDRDPVLIEQQWVPQGVTPRWWLMNRLFGQCPYAFTLSNPAQSRHVAFVLVQASHWASIYAVSNDKNQWHTVAHWTPWMY